jgi:Cu-Zn family superoxide dismutase
MEVGLRSVAVMAVLTLVACTPERRAVATLEARSGSSVTGTATFVDSGENVTLTVEVASTAEGAHAVHVHELGDCSAADGTSAGPHWNPESQAHGQWGSPPHHLGDIGNLVVGPDGTGKLVLKTDLWEVGAADAGTTNNVVGHSVIVHANVDDFTTQPTGNAGGRIACGVIGLATAGSGGGGPEY